MLDRHAFGYMECDVPEGLTLAEYRQGQHRAARSRAGRLIQRLRMLARRAG
jgi:hypothetical protein